MFVIAEPVDTTTEEPVCPYDETMVDTNTDPSSNFEVDSANTPDNPDDLFEPSPEPTVYQVKNIIKISPQFWPQWFRLLVLRFRVYPTKPTVVIITLVRKNSISINVSIWIMFLVVHIHCSFNIINLYAL